MTQKDLITNVAGGLGAAAMAAGPILSSTQGSMNGEGWSKLIAAVAIAVIGWFTGKDSNGKKKITAKE